MSNKLEIDGRLIGPEFPPYVIAELSANHNGSLDQALRLVDIASDAGADAVKIQTYTADTLTIDSDQPDFQITEGPWAGKSLYELYEWAHTPWDWHEPIFNRARERGLTIFSSPFDTTAVDLLENLGAPAYKIASFEAVDLELIAYAASTGKPMIISTGMADQDEIQEATETAKENGCSQLALLHCISGYPTPPEQSNLRTIADMAERFGCVIGLSDHTLGTTTAIAAVALGASLIEKHFTFRRVDGGPDAAFSLQPEELATLCRESKVAWEALGSAGYQRKPVEENSRIFRRSLYVVQDIEAGQELTRANIRSIRPGHGLPPRYLSDIIGRRAKSDISRGTPLAWDLIDGGP